jgi:hypothetical protein
VNPAPFEPYDNTTGGARDTWDARDTGGSSANAGRVGDFRQGNQLTQWALARYLLGRALAVQLSRTLIGLALLIAVVAGLVYYGGATVLAVLIGLVALVVLGLRSLVGALLRRTTMAMLPTAAEQTLNRLVRDTRADIGRELRRIGLPGRPWTMPFLIGRILGRRRADTFARLREFDVDRVVPAARLDELHWMVAAAASRSAAGR